MVLWPMVQILIPTERDVRLNDGVLPRVKLQPDWLDNGLLLRGQE